MSDTPAVAENPDTPSAEEPVEVPKYDIAIEPCLDPRFAEVYVVRMSDNERVGHIRLSSGIVQLLVAAAAGQVQLDIVQQPAPGLIRP